MPSSSVAIIGAGMAGAVAARTLADDGASVTVFEKSRGRGGRMATRRVAVGDETLHFDHGAQYFTARDERFARVVRRWAGQGLVARWEAPVAVYEGGVAGRDSRSVDRWVAVPTMSTLSSHLLDDLEVRGGTRVASATRDGDGYFLHDERAISHGPFGRVLVAVPPGQGAQLLAGFAIAPILAAVPMNPCWAVLAAFEAALAFDWGGAFINGGPVSWAARNGTKPGRPAGESLVLHGSAAWSHEHLEADRDAVVKTLCEAFWRATGHEPREPRYATAHRWRYAIPPEPLTSELVASDDGSLIACGDWTTRARVEGAYLSGAAAAAHVLEG